MTFLGLSGFFTSLLLEPWIALLVPVAAVVAEAAAAPPRRAGRPRILAAVVLLASFLVEGSIFSLPSGSANFTLFLTAGRVVEEASFLEVVPERARVVAVVALVVVFEEVVSASFLGRPRVALAAAGAAAASLDASVASFLAGRPRVVLAAEVAADEGSAAFLGRPRVGLAVISFSLSDSWSPSSSSALVFRLAAVLLVLAVKAEGADLALAAAVMIFVDLVPAVEFVAPAAALARVTRLGGDSMMGWLGIMKNR